MQRITLVLVVPDVSVAAVSLREEARISSPFTGQKENVVALDKVRDEHATARQLDTAHVHFS